jgi:hypothetical protein
MPRKPAPGPVQCAQTAEIAILWSDSGRQFKNVLHAQYTGIFTGSAAQATTLFSAFKTAMTSSAWVSHVHTGCSMTGVTIKDLNIVSQPELKSSGAAQPGTNATTPLSLSSAMVVSLRTKNAGRQWRGRVYLGGLGSDTLLSATQVVDTVGTSGVSFMTAVRNALASNQYTEAILQRALLAGSDIHGNPLPARTAHAEPVTSEDIANPRIDSQRRRTGR